MFTYKVKNIMLGSVARAGSGKSKKSHERLSSKHTYHKPKQPQ